MLRRTRKGLIIWGAVLLAYSFMIFVVYAFAGNGWQNRDLSTKAGAIVMFLLAFFGGVVMLTCGIINAVLTAKHNRELINQNLVFITDCMFCGRTVNCGIQDFRPHRRYPEGYTLCPFCKRAVSKNAFGVYQNNPPYQP